MIYSLLTLLTRKQLRYHKVIQSQTYLLNLLPTTQVDAHAEECFFDKVKTGTKMGLMFEVAEGGFLDIDVRIEGPDGKIVHQVWNSHLLKVNPCS